MLTYSHLQRYLEFESSRGRKEEREPPTDNAHSLVKLVDKTIEMKSDLSRWGRTGGLFTGTAEVFYLTHLFSLLHSLTAALHSNLAQSISSSTDRIPVPVMNSSTQDNNTSPPPCNWLQEAEPNLYRTKAGSIDQSGDIDDYFTFSPRESPHVSNYTPSDWQLPIRSPESIEDQSFDCMATSSSLPHTTASSPTNHLYLKSLSSTLEHCSPKRQAHPQLK